MPNYEQLIKSLQFCSQHDNCTGCPEENDNSYCMERIMSQAADTIEGLFCENEHLREIVESRAAPAPQRCGPMYIVSQSGSIVIRSDECVSFELAPIDRSRVLAYRDFRDYYMLGTYRNEDVAKTALSGLLFALEGQVTVYQMPKDPPPDEIPAWSETVKPC